MVNQPVGMVENAGALKEADRTPPVALNATHGVLELYARG